MESDLLKKEDEFYKENEKLEQKTKELMLQVNDVMKIQDNLIKESIKTKSEIVLVKQHNFKTIKMSGHPLSDIKLNQPELLHDVDEMGGKASIQFYRSKIKNLQVENIKLQSENRKKSEELKKFQKEKQKLQEEKDKWFMAYSTIKNNLGKLESQISSANSQLQGKDCEITALKKELDQAKKEVKNLALITNNLEVRLTRAVEENDKLKNSFKTSKDEEKELKESYRKQINELTNSMKSIEKQKLELLNAYKKQMQLIDNLKKQKIYVEGLKMSEFSEAEYLKILDWKLE
ncbi:unnamed protein product [Acanthoscelides obtectus]|uniref:Uncharacterized protein n=2 Tax=Acanthoscelides obtectus TaxID=200917 RepID=A0A9P0LZE0_ACAOB|nr:unnamed protein product [Acanthoscelides obtectus]CAK1657418.1 Testis-expressed protein 9 [Acanthoscelides obtectus]